MNFSKKMQQLFAILLVAVMVFSVLPAGTLSVFATVGEFAGGDGTAENPYLIATKTQLNNVRNFLDANFKLIADIEFTEADFEEGGDFYNNGAGFAPIGSDDSAPFTGTFDGDGYVIKNIYINIESDSTVYAGLFGYNKGTIKNLGIVDGSVSASYSSSSSYAAFAGGIAGYNDEGTIENCYNTGVVSSFSSFAYAGGIVGRNYEGTITNCYNTGDVSASSSSDYSRAYAGGIVGYTGGTITNCYNTGDVLATSTASMAYAYAGGIAGENYKGTIENCYNTGSVSASCDSYAYAGGIAGENYDGTITNCYNTGCVSASSSSSSSDANAYAGGIVGYNNGTITNCYNTGNVSASYTSNYSYAGGIAGVNDEGTVKNCYYLDNITQGVGYGTDTATKRTFEKLINQDTFVGFDFETVWTMDDEIGYPCPVLRDVPMVVEVDFAGGNGTAENPYLIASKTQLNNVRNYLYANFKMIADIEFDDADFEEGGDFYNNGAGFAPIGSSAFAFTGTFDGDGYVIKNLYVNIKSSSFDVYAGLFGYNEGTIKNLGIVDGSVSASSPFAYAGGIAGYNYKGTITNCYNTGSVSASSDDYTYAGGIAGYNKGTIQNCYNTGSVSASSDDNTYAGGIAGYNKEGTITNCYNIGVVSASSSSNYAYAYAGGIAGVNEGTITNCYNTGSVLASSSSSRNAVANAGGIAGSNSGTITNCYNTGRVSASSKASAYAGGIAGKNYDGATITTCYYLDNISVGVNGSTDTATKCTVEQLKNQETFVGFDFETVWTINSDSYYPYPVFKDNSIILIGKGDINGDGKVDSTDYLLIKRAAFGTYTFTEAMTLAGDINSNGSVDSADYLLAKRICFGTYTE